MLLEYLKRCKLSHEIVLDSLDHRPERKCSWCVLNNRNAKGRFYESFSNFGVTDTKCKVLGQLTKRNIFSTIILFKSNIYCIANYLIGLSLRERRVITPVHCRPSPENPSLQLQVYAPSVLVQIAAW